MNKKIPMMFLALVLVLSVFSFYGKTAFANHSVTDATPVNLNTLYQFTSQHEKSYYKVVVPANGMLEVKLSNDYGLDKRFAILGTNGGYYTDYTYTDDSQFASDFASHKIGLSPGTYYIEVYSPYEDNFSFKMGAYFTPSEYWEKESNDVVTQADELVLNKLYSAAVDGDSDDDFFSFTMVKDGSTKIKVSNTPDLYQKFELFYVKNGKKVDLFYNTTDDSAYASGYSTISVGLPKGKYYVRVSDPNNSFNGTINPTYKIGVDAAYTDDWEKEDNENVQTATPMKLDRYMNADLATDDIDFFKFTLSKGTNLQLNALNIKEGYFKYLITDSNGNEKFYLETIEGDYAKGYKTGRFYLPAGTYYLKTGSYAAAQYKFALKQVTPTLKGSNVTVTNYKTKSDTIYVKGIQKNDVVKVYSSKNKLLATKKATGTSTTATVKQLGKSTGYVYVTLTRGSMLESAKLKEIYKKE
ncbi:hypothetical protein LCY76_19590 [Fictibacillus sp. KIGAM418]|uniref:Peptidase C-terminal archaeal/bacterial domain-containing protein n=1 Tax=Fictibacillus marinisediminis TaxID=2878389 RepID=A0A9X2BFH7_9BACL|nr:hypothetical protein [Fictibacillus marinisediminis]MCK6258775.1 hypothetical protein [Fictibacillus marinisediminis]